MAVEQIKKFFEANLRKTLKEETKAKLGDRSKYIGASDIVACPRAAYLNKVSPVEFDIEKLMIFEGGHAFENVVEKMMGNAPYKREVEFTDGAEQYPIKVHCDFIVFNKQTKEATIIEVKTKKSDDLTPYTENIMQVQFQWYIAERSLKEHGWKVKNAYLVVGNRNTGKYEVHEVKKDENLQKLLIKKAKMLREALIKKEEPEGEEKLYCSSCPYRKSCGTFCKGAVGASFLEDEVQKILELEEQKKLLEEKIKAKKEALKKYLEEKEVSKVKTGEHIVSLTKETFYVTLDINAIKKDEKLYQELLSKYKKEIKRASSLKIK